jgi:hypothetical protein
MSCGFGEEKGANLGCFQSNLPNLEESFQIFPETSGFVAD